MRAAICYEINRPLAIEEVDLDSPGPGEVKIRLAATVISSSDLNVISGNVSAQLPCILGHECSGYVHEIGEGVTSLQPGDHVITSPILNWYPRTRFFRAHRCDSNGKPPLRLCGMIGGLSEYAIVEQSELIKIDRDMPLDKAALLAGPVITGFRAIVNLAQVRPFQSVAVIGCGTIGFNAIQGAAFCGAHPIIALDVSDERLKMARKFGATHTVNSEKIRDLPKQIGNITEGKGVDYALVTKQSAEAINDGSAIVAPRGIEIVVCKTMGELLSRQDREAYAETTTSGARLDLPNIRLDISRCVSLYKAGRLRLKELISGKFSLENVNQAIDSSKTKGSLCNMIVFRQAKKSTSLMQLS